MFDEKIIEKFWANVEKTESCWNWTGITQIKGGPALFILNGKIKNYYSARRISLTIIGIVLDRKNQARNTCNNNSCVNPQHMIYGTEARFWAKVIKLGDDECWPWLAGYDQHRYGQFTFTRKDGTIGNKAHIYSWQLANNRELLKGLVICHRCDNRGCVNPNHLTIGTVQDNSDDMVSKGRQCKGEKNSHAKLNEQQVIEMRKLFQDGATRKQLSQIFNLSTSATHHILSGKNWKHLLLQTSTIT